MFANAYRITSESDAHSVRESMFGTETCRKKFVSLSRGLIMQLLMMAENSSVAASISHKASSIPLALPCIECFPLRWTEEDHGAGHKSTPPEESADAAPILLTAPIY